MELKVGMYVRDEEYGIGKVTDICTCEQCEERGFYQPIIKYQNHSEYVTTYNNMQDYKGRAKDNFMDLIEAGDYLNGKCIWFEDLEEGNILPEEEIETIVTREQFKEIAYKIP